MHSCAHDEPKGPLFAVPAAPATLDRAGVDIEHPVTEAMDNVLREKLASFCPACPQPGINLPPDWEEDPERYGAFILCMQYIHGSLESQLLG